VGPTEPTKNKRTIKMAIIINRYSRELTTENYYWKASIDYLTKTKEDRKYKNEHEYNTAKLLRNLKILIEKGKEEEFHPIKITIDFVNTKELNPASSISYSDNQNTADTLRTELSKMRKRIKRTQTSNNEKIHFENQLRTTKEKLDKLIEEIEKTDTNTLDLTL